MHRPGSRGSLRYSILQVDAVSQGIGRTLHAYIVRNVSALFERLFERLAMTSQTRQIHHKNRKRVHLFGVGKLQKSSEYQSSQCLQFQRLVPLGLTRTRPFQLFVPLGLTKTSSFQLDVLLRFTRSHSLQTTETPVTPAAASRIHRIQKTPGEVGLIQPYLPVFKHLGLFLVDGRAGRGREQATLTPRVDERIQPRPPAPLLWWGIPSVSRQEPGHES